MKNNLIQPTLAETIDKNNYWSDDHPIAKKIDNKIMDFIAVDLMPYNVVEGEGFKRLDFANPDVPSKYRLKSEKFYRTALMPDTFGKVKEKVASLLKKAKWISFTSDIWTNASATCSLLSFTAHLIDGPKRLKVVLAAKVLEEKHTGLLIAQNLAEVAENFGILKKVHLGVRDNAPNMNAAMRIGGFTSVGCVSHTLQLVINETFLKKNDIAVLLTKCRKIVGHFNKSEPAYRQLKKFQHMLSLPLHKLIQDVPTRWNSSYLMMDRLVEQKSAINMYAVELGTIQTLNAEEWNHVSKVLPLLKIFYEATLEICYGVSCISIVIPLLAMLKNKLQVNDSDNCEITSLKSSMLTSLNTRFSHLSRHEFITATFLDPRFKTKYLTEAEVNECKIQIKDFLRGRCESDDNDSDDSLDEPVLKSNNNSIWDSHDKSTNDLKRKTVKRSTIEDEINAYLDQPLVSRDVDIFHFWHSSNFLKLKIMSEKYLSAPPTSVASEQLFSAAGQLFTDRRASLLGENAEKLLFLAYNIKLINFDY